jgi:hypothetical protein
MTAVEPVCPDCGAEDCDQVVTSGHACISELLAASRYVCTRCGCLGCTNPACAGMRLDHIDRDDVIEIVV